MNTEKLKNQFTSWNTADKLYSVNGTIFALCVNYNNELEYSTFYVNNAQNIITKCWQYEGGLKPVFKKFNAQIFYWKPLEDINFNGIQWYPTKEIPDKNKQIIAWVNESDFIEASEKHYTHIQLTTIQTRLHLGYFKKHWYGKKVEYKDYNSIPWKNVFRWCYVDDLFFEDKNEDARKLPINPTNTIDSEFIKKIYK